MLTSVTMLSPSTVGLQELTCTAAVATAARTAQKQLHVYRKALGEGVIRAHPKIPLDHQHLSHRLPGTRPGAEPSVSSSGQRGAGEVPH